MSLNREFMVFLLVVGTALAFNSARAGGAVMVAVGLAMLSYEIDRAIVRSRERKNLNKRNDE